MAVQVSEPARLWSLTETAEYLGVPEQTLRQWISRGTGPRSYKVGRFRKYDPSDVRAWLDSRASDRTTA